MLCFFLLAGVCIASSNNNNRKCAVLWLNKLYAASFIVWLKVIALREESV